MFAPFPDRCPLGPFLTLILLAFHEAHYRYFIRRPVIAIVMRLTESIKASFLIHQVAIMIYLFVLDDSLTSYRFTTRTEQTN